MNNNGVNVTLTLSENTQWEITISTDGSAHKLQIMDKICYWFIVQDFIINACMNNVEQEQQKIIPATCLLRLRFSSRRRKPAKNVEKHAIRR